VRGPCTAAITALAARRTAFASSAAAFFASG